jgi:hypothetical protein
MALCDLQATSDSELLKELMAEGEDLRAIAARVRTKLDEAASTVLRKQAAKTRSITLPTSLIRPAIDRLKSLVQEALQSRTDLAVAFRDGKKQSDSDWESLYDDLVALGVIKDDSSNNAH